MSAFEPALQALLDRAGIEPGVRTRLARYGAQLLEANRRLNLTGAKSPDALAEHLLDSLTILPYVSEPYVDIGSGGGLPAIPIAIASGIAPTMIEATAKKARFLAAALERLGVRGRILSERAEVAGRRLELRERFASGTARALGSAPTVAELLVPFLEIGGLAILQRGDLDVPERRALEDAGLVLGARVESEMRLEGQRRILLLRKLAATPPRFPRRTGVPEKRPLCG